MPGCRKSCHREAVPTKLLAKETLAAAEQLAGALHFLNGNWDLVVMISVASSADNFKGFFGVLEDRRCCQHRYSVYNSGVPRVVAQGTAFLLPGLR